MAADDGNGRRLRSRRWFDEPADPGDDRALSRALHELRHHAGRTARRQADHRHRADRLRPVAVQPAPHRTGEPRARRHPRRRRHAAGIPDPSDPGDRQAADRGARSQPRLSVAGRGAARLSDRRRGADHRLRQDHARLPDGRGDGEHPGDRAVRRADAGRLVAGPSVRLRHDRLGGPQALRRGQDRLRRVHADGVVIGAIGRATATRWARRRR